MATPRAVILINYHTAAGTHSVLQVTNINEHFCNSQLIIVNMMSPVIHKAATLYSVINLDAPRARTGQTSSLRCLPFTLTHLIIGE